VTAAVVGNYLDWVGILVCLVALIGAAGRMGLTHTHPTADPRVVATVVLAAIGSGVLLPATLPGMPGWVPVTAAAVVLVGFPLLLVCSARYRDRRFRRVQRESAVIRAAEAAAGLGSSSSDAGGGW